jgi:cbb3-type cytochrome c oxidase subunit III
MKRLASALLAIGMLAACAKGGDSSSTSASSEPSAAASAAAATAAAAPAENGAAASDGAKVYEQNCSSCHQATGTGIKGTFPPLAGNDVVTGDATKVVHIVKYGLNGSITVGGATFNGMMPAWGQQLSNKDIASVITYIRSAWGNKASAVTEADVAGVAQ